MAEPPAGFAVLLRKLRREARLTQEELAEAAGVSLRAVSYLERGVVASPQKDTVRLLADALGLIGPARAGFEAAARGRAAPGGVAAATRTLPRDIASFTGRAPELEQLAKAAVTAGGVVSIHAIGGMAGVGKTAFAVHAAHRLAGRFPGGQIFLPLHGHTPAQEPVDPEDALASLLLTAGVAPAQIPPGVEARMALWRDRLAGQRLLLVLDDAASSEQVLPLLPVSGGSLVLVTSRRHLSALENATAVSLDTLPPDEAAGLLVRLAGRPGLSAADPGVREIVRLCGFLPLAIGLAARQLHHHPAWSVAGRAAELAAARDRLELLAAESLSVTAAFDLSYADLTADQQRLFRRLGLHPGAEFDGYAAAALDGTEVQAARRGLEALYDQYLLAEPAPGRYRMHDLIREHARALAGRIDPDRDRDQATGRLLDYYQHAAARALGNVRRQTGEYPAAAQALEQALAISGELGSRLGEAGALLGLGIVRRAMGDYPGAAQGLEQALGLYRSLGVRDDEAEALNEIGVLHRISGDLVQAEECHQQALDLARAIASSRIEAHALGGLGRCALASGRATQAAALLHQALEIFRRIGAAEADDLARELTGLAEARPPA